MPKHSTGSHLRLHIESLPEEDRAGLQRVPGLQSLLRSFQRLTGRRLDCLPRHAVGRRPAWAMDLPSGPDETDATRLVIDRREAEQSGAPPWPDVQKHAEAIGKLLAQLQRTRRALWQREAELAAGVPVVEHPDEQHHLAARLQAVLRGGASAVECQAAALYMLDEATRELKLRAHWGLSTEELLEPARPLASAMADLEALLGHAVVLEEPDQLDRWHGPQYGQAAVCVPVATPTMLLGTLWMFADRPRRFSLEQSCMIEIVAGCIAAQLERQMLLVATRKASRIDQQLAEASRWQRLRLPTVVPPLSQWQLAGRAAAVDELTGTFYDWHLVPDGRLVVMLGEAHGPAVESALSAAALHGAVKAHSAHCRDAAELVRLVNDTVWTSSVGDSRASLVVALAEPESGQLDVAGAGLAGAVLLEASGCRTLMQPSQPLGVQPGVSVGRHLLQLGPDDSLILFDEAARAAAQRAGRGAGGEAIEAALAGKHGSSAERLLEHVQALIDTYAPVRPMVAQSLVALRRRPA